MASEIGGSAPPTTGSGAGATGNVDRTGAVRGPKECPDSLALAFDRELSFASRSVHADDYINSHRAVAPPMHVSTTFRYARNPDEMVPWTNTDVCYAFCST